MEREITREQMNNNRGVDVYLKAHGHLPDEKCGLALCDEHEAMECAICKCKICKK